LEESVPAWGSIVLPPGTYRKVHEAIASESRMEQWILVEIFASSAREFPENATSDSKVSANITKTNKVCRLAAVCSSFASTGFQRFLPDWQFLGNTMENNGK
jgi:hypothetical protein